MLKSAGDVLSFPTTWTYEIAYGIESDEKGSISVWPLGETFRSSFHENLLSYELLGGGKIYKHCWNLSNQPQKIYEYSVDVYCDFLKKILKDNEKVPLISLHTIFNRQGKGLFEPNEKGKTMGEMHAQHAQYHKITLDQTSQKMRVSAFDPQSWQQLSELVEKDYQADHIFKYYENIAKTIGYTFKEKDYSFAYLGHQGLHTKDCAYFSLAYTYLGFFENRDPRGITSDQLAKTFGLVLEHHKKVEGESLAQLVQTDFFDLRAQINEEGKNQAQIKESMVMFKK